jgi:DNA-binding XRE family transcriptional regulator
LLAVAREKHLLRERNPLYQFRIEQAMSNQELASTIGYRSVDGLLRLIRYENGPSLRVAIKIADLLHVSVDQVLRDYAKNVPVRRASRRAA